MSHSTLDSNFLVWKLHRHRSELNARLGIYRSRMIKIQFKCPKKTAHNSIPFRSVYGSCFISIFIVIEQEDDGDADDNDDNNGGVSVRQATSNCIQKTTENQMELFGI